VNGTLFYYPDGYPTVYWTLISPDDLVPFYLPLRLPDTLCLVAAVYLPRALCRRWIRRTVLYWRLIVDKAQDVADAFVHLLVD